MTAPTSMPMPPVVVARAAAPSGTGTAGDGAPAFASALDDALAGGGSASGRASSAEPEQSGDAATTTEDATTAAALVAPLPPGLWALLAAAQPVTPVPTVPETAPVAAGLVVGAVEDTGVPAAAPVATVATGTGTPALPADSAVPLTGVELPAARPATPATGTAPTAVAASGPAGQLPAALADLAADAGLTVVVDPASAAAVATPAASAASSGTAAASDLLVALPPVPADTAGTGSDSTGGGPGTGAAAALEPAPADGADTVPTSAGPAPLTPSAPAPAAEPAAPALPAGDDAPVAEQLGRQMAVLRNAPDGSQTMTVVLTPETLGPVTVEVRITDGTLDLTLHGATTAGRHALTDALPELRRELEGAGLTFSRLEIDTSTRDSGAGLRGAQEQLLDSRSGQQGSSGRPGQDDARARAWGSSSDLLGEGSTALTTDQSASSGVDVRV